MNRAIMTCLFLVACGPSDPSVKFPADHKEADSICRTCPPPPPPPPPPVIAVTANPNVLFSNSSSQLTATVNGAVISGVSWSLRGNGSLSSSSTNPVTFNAGTVSAQTTVTVTAASAGKKSGTTVLTVGPPALVNTFPQGLTAGIAYVNHQCTVTLAAIAAIGSPVVGWLNSCTMPFIPLPDGGSPSPGPCVTSTAAVINAVIQTVNGASFTSCGAPSTFVTGYGPDGNHTLEFVHGNSAFAAHASPGWQAGADGDYGNSTNFGFYHQEMLVNTVDGGAGIMDQTQSQRFALPKGTACGFHHSKNTPYSSAPDTNFIGSCMGGDPYINECPAGWNQRQHFDMSSTNGYFTWCEYTDPYGYCTNNLACLETARQMGLGLQVSSDTDATGGSSYGNTCPTGWARTGYFDDGRGATWGLSWCLPIPDLPQGQTFGLTYFESPGVPLNPFGYPASALGTQVVFGYTGYAPGDDVSVVQTMDGDLGAPSGQGFVHAYLAIGGVTAPSQSGNFVLPKGTTCGFHHTINTPGLTCMGIDPLNGCPAGWNQKKHFDMSSGSGYFVWCEYTDPKSLCEGQAQTNCITNADMMGVTIGVSSVMSPADPGGLATYACPLNEFPVAGPFDSGDPSGQGLAYCVAE
jgi:hypothetical protein